MTEANWAELDVLVTEGRLMTREAFAGRGDTFGRSEELCALVMALAGQKSAVLVGPPGVGKTAIVRKLAGLLAEESLADLLGVELWELSTTGLVSGTRYTGMQEDKIQALLRDARPNRVIYVPDLWNLPQAGSYDTNPRGIYDLMRPGIECERLVLLGEMTPGRWDRFCRMCPSAERDFAALTVDPTSDADTAAIVEHLAEELASRVTFDERAQDRLLALCRKFLPTQSFPGKAVDFMRRVTLARRADPRLSSASVPEIDEAFVEEHFASETGLPLHVVSDRIRIAYDDMHSFLSERVLGQREAVRAVCDTLALYKTGLSNPERPVGVLLLVGPTGVGKTELAKATAEFVFGSRQRMFRVDLSEYKDYHSFEKLIGDPKTDKPGLLTEFVRKNPFCVILLDEFEKGHHNVADLFLQVFDDGRLTDARGETVSFQHALIFLTSNVGSDVAAFEQRIGFAGEESSGTYRMERDIRRSLEAHYRPEFLNRIDRVLCMQPLARTELLRIARRELGKVYQREGFLDRDLLLEIDEAVLELLVDSGTDPKYGARPLKRAIEEMVVVPIARQLLAQKCERFALLRLTKKGMRVVVGVEPTETSRRLARLDRRAPVDDGEGRTLHLSLVDVSRGVGQLALLLARIEAAVDLPALSEKLSLLERQGQSPAFWEDAFGREGTLVERHRLSFEISRLRALGAELSAVSELAQASLREAEDAVRDDLVRAYARLTARLRRAERELLLFSPEERKDARITIFPSGAGTNGTTWVSELCSMYQAWATGRGYDVEQAASEGGGLHLAILGPYAYGYLRGETGGHRLLLPPGKDERRGQNFLARVVVHADGEQHAELDDDTAPIRTYDLWHSHGVRDRVTGYAEGDARKVLEGRLDAFLEAFADKKRPPSPSPD